MEMKTKTPGPADSDSWRSHWEVVDKIEGMAIEALFDDNGRSDEAATSLGLLLNLIQDVLYRTALEPVTDRNELARCIAGAMLADHYGRVLRDAEAARKAGNHSSTSKIWKLTNGVKGAPANEIFKAVFGRPAKRKGRSDSKVANWLRFEILLAAHQHKNGDVIHSSGLRLPSNLREFGASEEEKETWRYWMMSMMARRFITYVEQPEHLREEAHDAPPPTWRNHQGSTAHDAFEHEWRKHSRNHKPASRA